MLVKKIHWQLCKLNNIIINIFKTNYKNSNKNNNSFSYQKRKNINFLKLHQCDQKDQWHPVFITLKKYN